MFGVPFGVNDNKNENQGPYVLAVPLSCCCFFLFIFLLPPPKKKKKNYTFLPPSIRQFSSFHHVHLSSLGLVSWGGGSIDPPSSSRVAKIEQTLQVGSQVNDRSNRL